FFPFAGIDGLRFVKGLGLFHVQRVIEARRAAQSRVLRTRPLTGAGPCIVLPVYVVHLFLKRLSVHLMLTLLLKNLIDIQPKMLPHQAQAERVSKPADLVWFTSHSGPYHVGVSDNGCALR